MNITVQTIPELLVKTRGNQSEVALQIGVTRTTVKKYSRDTQAKYHIIKDGRLMVLSMRKDKRHG